MLQRLLSGTLRFKEFGKASKDKNDYPKNWKNFKLNEIAEILFSTVDKKCYPGENKVQLCNYMDVYTNDEITDSISFMTATASDSAIERFHLRKHDVLLTKDSETPDDIARSAVVTKDFHDVVCGYHLAIIRPDPEKVFGPFLSNCINFYKTHKQFVTSANGATRYGLGLSSVNNIEIAIPEINEQKKISQFLDIFTHEINILIKQETKLIEEKKAIMKKLFSSKGLNQTR